MNHITPLLALALAACSPLQSSHACESVPAARCPGLAEVQVLDRANGQTMPVYRHNGELWVAGIPGHSYAVRLHNSSPGRILTVVSVDGVNAVSGQTAGWNQAGYVLSSWESYDVAGWRKSQERVADFVFTALDDSYAAMTGRPHDVGVIGVAIFRERVAEPPVAFAPSAPQARADSAGAPAAAPAPARSNSSGSNLPDERALAKSQAQDATAAAEPAGSVDRSRSRLGTGHGQNEYSYVGTTHFERAHAEPDLVVTIRYDRPETLVALGVIPGAAHPRPFPDSAALGFVPDPPAGR